MGGLLDDVDGRVVFVKFQDTVLARIVNIIGEHGGALGALRRISQFGAQTMAVEHIVAEDKGDTFSTHEVASENEGMGKADRFLLDDVVEGNAPTRAVAQQVLIER